MYLTMRPRLVGQNKNLVQRYRGGVVFKTHRLVYHSTLGLKAIEKKKSDLPQALDIIKSTIRRRTVHAFTHEVLVQPGHDAHVV